MASGFYAAYDRLSKSLFLVMVLIVLGVELYLGDTGRLLNVLLVGSIGFLLSTFVNLGIPMITYETNFIYPVFRYNIFRLQLHEQGGWE